MLNDIKRLIKVHINNERVPEYYRSFDGRFSYSDKADFHFSEDQNFAIMGPALGDQLNLAPSGGKGPKCDE